MESIFTDGFRKPETKVCVRCGLSQPLKAFGIHLTTNDGRNAQCRDCARRRDRMYSNLHRRDAGKTIDQQRAMSAVRRAILKGTLTRPSECFHCHEPAKLQAHHYMGYDPQFRLMVQWLCPSCHTFANRKRKPGWWHKGWEGAA